MRAVFLWVSALALASGCLVLGEESSESPSGSGGGGSGGAIGDGSWPDGPGNGGSATGGGGAPTGGGGAPTGGASSGGGGAPSGGGGAPSGGGGAPSGGGGGPTGGGGTGGSGGSPGWTLYAYNWGNGTWSAPTALDLTWSGANAPPSMGIAAATQLEHFDRLLVFTDAGKMHVRAAGTWLAPVSTASKFPALAAVSLKSVYHVASPPGQPLSESLTFVANPQAFIYAYAADDTVKLDSQVTMKDEAPPGPPQGSGTVLWDFEVRDPALWGTSADYFRGYYGYANGTLYQFDAAFAWKSWPLSSAPIFAGKPNAPSPTKMRAAWFDAKLNRAYFAGPG